MIGPLFDGATVGMTVSQALHRICAVSDVAPGTARRVTIGDLTIAVFNLGGDFFATDDICTHGFASLSEGYIEDGIVECPWHGGRFDIRTGAPREDPCRIPLRVYAVTIRDADVWVDLHETTMAG
jgi:nitrite reductase/ring-hydroxylating ferredoxin subunit